LDDNDYFNLTELACTLAGDLTQPSV
jgi:hypothetical protein